MFNDVIDKLCSYISRGTHFVMAGSMDSFNAPFVPLFDLAIHITASISNRLLRINKREYERYGDRIMEGGDMYEEHCRFLDISARYDTDGSPCMSTHSQWANSLPCKVLRINGDEELNENVAIIVQEYLVQEYLMQASQE